MRIFVLFFLISISLNAQINKQENNIYKVIPSKPYENIFKGYVIVFKNMYGLNYKNNQLKENDKMMIEKFFKKRLKGYQDLKKYTLKFEKRADGFYIENHKMQ